MKPTKPSEPLYTFQYPNLGYSIQIIPHTPADSAKITCQAKSLHISLQDCCRNIIIDSMVLTEFD
jgi:hypothetical protein